MGLLVICIIGWHLFKEKILYLTPTERHWACDIEADNLLDAATLVWCVCVENVLTGEKHAFTDPADFRAFLDSHPDCYLVGHNFIAYDLVMLNRHWGTRLPATRIVDTFVLSQLFNPTLSIPAGLKAANALKPKAERKGAHSLEAWGFRVKLHKTEHTDFSEYTPEMLEYCGNDTTLTAKVFRRLSERMRQIGFSEEGCEIEHLAWNIIQNKQKKNGFPFQYQTAHGLYVTLRAREEELKNEIYKLWPPQLLIVGEYKQARKKNGEYTKGYLEHRGKYVKLEETDDGGYRAYDWVEFNLGSVPQRIEKLLEAGWTPNAYTKAGNPKVDEDALLDFAETSGKKEVVALAKWIVINSRANMINTWLNAYNEKTGAIHGRLFLASTLRYRHSDPNSANIPAVRLKKNDEGVEHIQYGEDGAYSYECRDLWICGDPSEWSLVGIDGTGIQNRCLIHNLIKTVGEERVRPFKELALEGDVHKHNISVLGLANKAAAKKFYYTLMMGGGGARLAADQAQFGTKLTSKEGDALKTKMISSIPGFHDLIDVLEKQLERNGRIILCDGTPILVPSPHMVIPYLLQGDESRLMKKAMIFVDQEVRRARLADHVFKVADIHDEWQYKVRRKYVDDFIRIALPCFNRAGSHFNYLIAIDGDAKVGRTWAETH